MEDSDSEEYPYEDPEFCKAEMRDRNREMVGVYVCEEVRKAAERRVAELHAETKRRVGEVYAETRKRMDEIYRDVQSRLSIRREQHIAESRMETDPGVADARLRARCESDIVEEFAEMKRQWIQLYDQEAGRTAEIYEKLRGGIERENAEMKPRLLAEMERVAGLELEDE